MGTTFISSRAPVARWSFARARSALVEVSWWLTINGRWPVPAAVSLLRIRVVISNETYSSIAYYGGDEESDGS